MKLKRHPFIFIWATLSQPNMSLHNSFYHTQIAHTTFIESKLNKIEKISIHNSFYRSQIAHTTFIESKLNKIEKISIHNTFYHSQIAHTTFIESKLNKSKRYPFIIHFIIAKSLTRLSLNQNLINQKDIHS